MVLLHGPGESAACWLPVLDALGKKHQIIAPDLPGHGASTLPSGDLDAERLVTWLDALIEQTCTQPPVLVGRVVGGAIAARYAIAWPERVAKLVLVDTLGLVPFGPTPRFGLALRRFLAQPSDGSYLRLMEFCAFDLDAVRERLGRQWEPYARYAVELADSDVARTATGALLTQFAPPIPPAQLDRIDVPTALVWGREDIVTQLDVAEAASARHGWPLHVIDDAGDDPALDQPAAFVAALDTVLAAVPAR
jgi:pimeloyl-ACP methyl ester carboxylesterase